MINGSSTNVLLPRCLLICLWEHDMYLWGNSPGRQPGRAHYQGHQQVDEVPVAGDKHFQKNCRKDGIGGKTKYPKISIRSSSMDGNPAHNSKRTQDWLKKNLTGGVVEGDLDSQLPWLQPFWLFFRWRPWIKGQSKSSKKTRDLIT